MVVEVTINNRGISNQKLKLLDVILQGMRYGSFDDYFRLNENKIDKSIVVFDSQKICRGHEVSLNDELILLTLNLPTNENDIIYFYHHVKCICQMIGTNVFTRDGTETSLDHIDSFIEFDKAASIHALQNMQTRINNGEFENMCIYGAINPITFGEKDLEMIESDLEKFGNYMDKLQRLDVYYARPNIYSRKDGTLFGIYVLSENITSVFPLNPQPILFQTKIPQFFVTMVMDKEPKGNVPYIDFIQNIDKSNKYDFNHFIITLGKEEISNLLENFKTEV